MGPFLRAKKFELAVVQLKFLVLRCWTVWGNLLFGEASVFLFHLLIFVNIKVISFIAEILLIGQWISEDDIASISKHKPNLCLKTDIYVMSFNKTFC